MDNITAYPQLLPFLDPDAERASVERQDDGLFLVTMRGEEGGQLLLREVEGAVELVAADNVIDQVQPFAAPFACVGACTPVQHTSVAQAIIAKVDHFSSRTGPDGGNLACVWAVRHIVHETLGFWITQSDGTATFAPVLLGCFGDRVVADDVAPGGIIISPTSGSRIGHIGLLGAGQGGDRLVYSNSSAAAMWKQNHTVRSWRARYHDTKGLQVYFFPLPRFA